MAVKFAAFVVNAALDQMEAAIGLSPTLEIRTGAPPASPEDPDAGTLLATLTLPSDWMAAASGASKAKAGTWSGTVTVSGTAGHFRIKTSGGAPSGDGTVSQRTEDGGTGDMRLAQASAALVAGQGFTVSNFTISGVAVP